MSDDANNEINEISEAGNGAQAPDNPPLAIVSGKPITEMPKDLYIPPDALRVFLDPFEGPLDFLLYLIRAQNLDILSLPIAKITDQYTSYIEMMEGFQIELATEYMLMAAILAEIKSRMLLPRPIDEEGDEEDPRAELVRRLLEYERYKKVAGEMGEMPRIGRDFHAVEIPCDDLELEKPLPEVQVKELAIALQRVLLKAQAEKHHKIVREPLPIQDRITSMLTLLRSGELTRFEKCFTEQEGVAGVVVSFLALLNLLKAGMITTTQSSPYAPIYLRAA